MGERESHELAVTVQDNDAALGLTVKLSPRRLGLLTALYFVQGMPFGFQAIALPVYLRSQGVSIVALGFVGATGLVAATLLGTHRVIYGPVYMITWLVVAAPMRR